MSTNLIEKEVVKMEFDNSDFEKKTKESMSTIEKLKKALNFDTAKETLSNFAKQANELDFNGLKDSVDTIAKRFSNLGIVGMTVISRLTNAMVDGVKKIANSISGMIVSGGISRAMNIEKAKFQLEGLGIAWDDIKEDIDHGVKDTAYGLDSAASAAAQLSAAGVQIGDQMKTSLRAISGVAAMTGSTYDEIAYIFERAAGTNRVMGGELTMLSERGINAAAELGKALGKTESEIREMASKGQIDFNTFAKAMDDAFGQHAKDANKTLNGTLNNIRAAWARVGAEFVQPIIRNEGELVDLLNAYREKINDIKEAIIPVAQKTTTLLNQIIASFTRTIKEIDIKDKVKQIGEGITDVIGAFQKLWTRMSYVGRKVKEVYSEIFPKKEAISISASFAKVTKAINGFFFNSEQIKKIQSIFKGFFSVIKVGQTIFKNLLIVVKPIFAYITKEAGKMFDIAAAIGELISKIALGTIRVEDVELTLEKVTETIQGSLNKLTEGFKSLLGVFQDDEKGAKDAFDAIVDIVTGAVDTILATLELITGLDFSEIRKSFEEFSNHVKYFLRTMYDIYKEAGGGAEGLAAVITEVMSKIAKKITDFIEKTTGIDLSALKLKLDSFLKTATDKITAFLDKVKPLSAIGDAFTFVKDRVKELSEALTGLAKSASIGLGKLLENPVSSIIGIKGVTAVIDTLRQLARDGSLGGFSNTLNQIRVSLVNLFASINGRTILTTAAAIVALGYAMKIFAGGIAEIAKVPKVENTMVSLTEMLIALGGLFVALKSILMITAGLNFKGETIVKPIRGITNAFKLSAVKIAATSILVLSIAASLKILIDALSEIAKLDSGIENHVTACIEIFGLLVLLGEALKKLSTLKPVEGLKGSFFLVYAATFVVLAEAVKIMAEAFVTLNSEVVKIKDFGDLMDTLLSFAIVIGIMAALVTSLNKIKITNVQNLVALGIGVYAIAEGVSVLVEAINKIKGLNAEEALMGLVTVFTLLRAVMKGAYLLGGTAISLKTSAAFISIAAAMAILVHEINVLADTPIDDIVKGFTTIVAILGAFVVAASFFQNELRGLAGAGFATLEFSAALYVMVKAMKQLKDLNPDQIADSFLVLMGALLTFAAILTGLNQSSGLVSSGFALLEIGAALYIIAQAIGYLGAQDIFNVLKGAGSLIIFLELLCVSVTKFTMALPGAQALLIVCAALGVLAASIAILAPLGSVILVVGATLIGFIVVLGVVATAANFTAAYLTAGATAIAAALAVIGLGLMAVVAPIGIFALSLGLIASSATYAADGLKAFVETLAQLAIDTAANIGTMSQLAQVMLLAGVAMVSGGAALIVMGIGLAAFAVGATAAGVGATVLAGGLVLLAGALEMLIAVLQAAKLDGLVQSLGLDFGKNFSQGAADGIKGTEGIVIAAISALVKKSVGEFNKEAGINSPSKVFAESGKYIDMGLAEGITNNSSLVEDASKMLGEKTSTSLNTSLTQGTKEGSKTLEDAVKQFATITEKGSEAAGANTGIGFMKGLQAIAPKVKAYAANIGKQAYLSMKNYLKIKSPSRLTEELGEYTGEGFIVGMRNTESGVENSAEDLGRTAEKSLTTALSAAYDNLASGVEDPTIKPVLDLSEIQNGASRIDSMLSRDYANNISSNYKSNRDYTAEQAQANASLMSGLNDSLISAIAANGMSDLPINVTVQLAGDAAGVFRLVLAENQRQTNMYGASPLLRG